ncbi:MAG: glycosyltransferase [Sphingobacteriia bacterium]|nr:glycosyltransferase [Sphingobacteriia bacterium]
MAENLSQLASPEISVVVPVYGCAECLIALTSRLIQTLNPITTEYEIILVNDFSPDDSWNVVKQLGKENPKIKGIHFSRNFGQHFAISAGLDFARGKWTVVMDCDLQDPPEEITKLYAKAMEGYDIVYAVAEFRGDKSWLYQQMRKVYFNLYDRLAQNKFKTENLSFYIISAEVRESVCQFREQARHISSLLRHVGFKIVGIPIEHVEREFGKSSYTFSKRLNLALIGIIAHSSLLLKFSLYIGFLFSFFSFGFGIYILLLKLITGTSLPGWTSLAILVAFSTGLILSVLGIIGIYLEKIYLETKRRPLYLIKEKVNLQKPSHE